MYDGRPNSVFALLIASTAYQLSIDNLMPEVPYLTWLDKFNMFSFLIMIAVAVESIIVLKFAGNQENDDDVEDIEYWDSWGAKIIVFVWIIGYVYFILLGLHLRVRELIKLNM